MRALDKVLIGCVLAACLATLWAVETGAEGASDTSKEYLRAKDEDMRW